MKNILRRIFIAAIIVCGIWYIMDCTEVNLKSEAEIRLDEKNALINSDNVDNVDEGIEIILVNSMNGLRKDYKPECLTIPDIPFADLVEDEERYVADVIAKPLEDLVKAAKAEGIVLLGNSGYRSYKTQRRIYINRVESAGQVLAAAYVAKPGFSEHQTGLCIDITNKSGNFIKGTTESDWLAENCYKFGFIVRYPYGKKSITGIEYEPWHIRYVGEKAAKDIYDNNITLEEYLEK